jgi:hypothetical protein
VGNEMHRNDPPEIKKFTTALRAYVLCFPSDWKFVG